MKLIAAGLIDDYLDHGALIVDLRSAEAYQETHIRGAVNIPEEEMENAMSGLPHHRTIVLYCEHGTTSVAVGRKLSHAGFHVASAIGGIRAYRGRYLIR